MNLNTKTDILLEKLDHVISESKVNQTNAESMLNRVRDAEVKLRDLLHHTNELVNKISNSTSTPTSNDNNNLNLSMSLQNYEDESFSGDRYYITEARFKQTLNNLSMAFTRLNRYVGNVTSKVTTGIKVEEQL